MSRIFSSIKNLTKFEIALWFTSVLVVTVSYISVDKNWLSLAASILGVSALIFVAKGDVLGQFLCIFFSLFYAAISYSFRYYGEMITYLCMSAPSALLAVISWLRHPYKKCEVRINRIKPAEFLLMAVLSVVATVIFYFVLKHFNTANLFISTLSVTTSFAASYLTFRRSAFYGIAYGLNDIILIIMWILASIKDISYLPMIFCFIMFLANDVYGYINWSRIQGRQNAK